MFVANTWSANPTCWVCRMHLMANAAQPMLGQARAQIMAQVQERVLQAMADARQEKCCISMVL